MRKMTKAGILEPRAGGRGGPSQLAAPAVAVLGAAIAWTQLAPPLVAQQDDAAGGAAATAEDPAADADAAKAKKPHAGDKIDGKRLIGATAVVVEAKTGIPFAARVDTGAQGTSVHVEEWLIDDKPEEVAQKKNIGKRIRFLIHNQQGQDAWLDGLIVDTVLIKNAEKKERRYKVVVTLRVGEFEKECIVNINDRSGMTYPILIGRNFLHGDFLVDVSLDEAVAIDAPKEEPPKNGEEEIEQDEDDEVELADTGDAAAEETDASEPAEE